MIEPVQKINVTQQVFDQMLNLIYGGEWKVGQRLPSESDLCTLFGVSRVTIRQAIHKLAALDLVETRHGEGSFVKETNSGSSMNVLLPEIYLRNANDSLQEVLEYRELIEIQSARLAAIRCQPADCQILRDTVDQMEKAVIADDKQAFVQADVEFHLQIARMTQNNIILKIHEIMRVVLTNALRDSNVRMGYMGLWYHKEVLGAIEEKNPEKSAAYMRELIASNRQYIPPNGNGAGAGNGANGSK